MNLGYLTKVCGWKLEGTAFSTKKTTKTVYLIVFLCHSIFINLKSDKI